jgi:hypothetical protein
VSGWFWLRDLLHGRQGAFGIRYCLNKPFCVPDASVPPTGMSTVLWPRTCYADTEVVKDHGTHPERPSCAHRFPFFPHGVHISVRQFACIHTTPRVISATCIWIRGCPLNSVIPHREWNQISSISRAAIVFHLYVFESNCSSSVWHVWLRSKISVKMLVMFNFPASVCVCVCVCVCVSVVG